jgi:ATP-binding protein involved in chromosome partitioning
MSPNREEVLNVLAKVMDPELGRDLVSLGMVKDIGIRNGTVSVTVELTTPACPLKNKIEGDVIEAISSIQDVEKVVVNLTAKVPADKQIKEKIELEINNIIAVASGKGGVGKSTVAVNLAVALAQTGARVGIMDADIYGPNIPTMMGIQSLPEPKNKKMVPAIAYGVKVMSIGLLVKPGQPLIWRGPLLHSTIRQFLTDVDWGSLDYLVVDLPPGTGDVQLSLSQHIPITCGVIVTMPQKVSLEDASRGIEMFQKLSIPIAGVVENMGSMHLPDGQVIEVFGEGGGEEMARAYGLDFIGRIPLDPEIRINGDAGLPIVMQSPDSKPALAFNEIACKVAAFISEIHFAKSEK